MQCQKLAYAFLISAASAGIGFPVGANATTVTVNNAFVMLDNVSANLDGVLAGENVFYGANSVVPNGSLGTTGAAFVNGSPSPLPRAPLSGGSYQFNMQVNTGQTYYIDPTVATGYVYKTSPGEPNFASVVLPNLQGLTPYHLSYVYGGNNFAIDLLGGVLFNFQSGGVDQFTVTGIDPTLMLDPHNSTAFITGLTFTSDGQFTGTQTAITADVAATPLPAGLPLFATGVGALSLLGWRKKKKAGALVGGGFMKL